MLYYWDFLLVVGEVGLVVWLGNGWFVLVCIDMVGVLEGIIGMVVDVNGYLWFNGSCGLVWMESGLLCCVLCIGLLVMLCLFDVIDGMFGIVLQSGLIFIVVLVDDGLLWLVINQGLVWLDIICLYVNMMVFSVCIGEVLYGSEYVLLCDGLCFLVGISQLQIDYVVLFLVCLECNCYCYCLLGVDDGWQDVGSSMCVYYINFVFGSYWFEVEVVNEDGIWSFVLVSCSFCIVFIFMQIVWFKLLCIVVVVVLLVLVVCICSGQLVVLFCVCLQECNGECECIVCDLYDILLQGSQGLILCLYVISQLVQIFELVCSQFELVMQLVECNLVEGCEWVNVLCEVLFVGCDFVLVLVDVYVEYVGYGINFLCLIVEGVMLLLQVDVVEEVFLIGCEVICNVLCYVNVSVIEVELFYGMWCFLLYVCDDGVGIVDENVGYGYWGLQGMCECVQCFGVELQLWICFGLGIEVVLVVLVWWLYYCC